MKRVPAISPGARFILSIGDHALAWLLHCASACLNEKRVATLIMVGKKTKYARETTDETTPQWKVYIWSMQSFLTRGQIEFNSAGMVWQHLTIRSVK
jgi:hypothetical protein